MERQNVTLSLPKDTLRRAKVLAAERGTSLSALLVEALIDRLGEAERYSRAARRHMRRLEEAVDLGTGGHASWSREELHER